MSVLKRTILSVVGNALLSKGRVAAAEKISDRFRFIEIEADVLRGRTLRPGEKIQIDTGDWNVRTYTPISLDPETGRLGVLAFLHGNGPGSDWAARARRGDECRFVGPHQSLKIADASGPIVLFGDETALAVAASVERHFGPARAKKFVFEAAVPGEVTSVAADLGLRDVAIIPKGGDGAIPDDAFAALSDAIRGLDSCHVILAGRASSIRSVRERLRGIGFPFSRVQVKAYWADGKAGLD